MAEEERGNVVAITGDKYHQLSGTPPREPVETGGGGGHTGGICPQ